MPPDVAANTIIIFTSDHGDYVGAHGLVSGKTGSFYDECVRVPLIVADPTGRFTRDPDVVRTQLTSSVDFLPMIVTLGYNGRRSWLTRDLAQVYGSHHRHDMLPLLRSANAPGRRYVLFTTDESMPPVYNFLEAPAHIVGIRTERDKFAFYCFWQSGTTDMVLDDTVDREFYDYATPQGAAEVHSTPEDRRARARYDQLVKDLIPRELRAPLPKSMLTSSAVGPLRR
jgi:arylsulfatase A-like enzyme